VCVGIPSSLAYFSFENSWLCIRKDSIGLRRRNRNLIIKDKFSKLCYFVAKRPDFMQQGLDWINGR